MSAAPLPTQNRLLAERASSAQISEAKLHLALPDGHNLVIRWSRDAYSDLHRVQDSGLLLWDRPPGLSSKQEVTIDRLLPLGYPVTAGTEIVGIYRKQSHPSHNAATSLNGNDLTLLAKVCQGPSALAVVITSSSGGNADSASLFVKNRGILDPETPAKTFPLPGAGLPVSDSHRHAYQWKAFAAAISFAACGGIFVAASFGNGLWKERKKPESPLFGARLGITTAVSPSGALHLQWDSEAKAIQQADRAQISIASPSGEERVSLTSADLRKGFFIWDGAAGSVLFRLSVNTPSGEVTESVRSLVPTAPNLKTIEPDPEPLQTVSSPEPGTSPSKFGALNATRSRKRNLRTFELPVQGSRSGKGTESASAGVELATAPALAIPSRLDTLDSAPSVIGLSEKPRPQVVAAVESQRPSFFKKVFGMGVGDWVPAAPSRRVTPALKMFPNWLEKISIRLSIDKKGEVANAELLTRNLDRATNLAVMEAARQWRFEPARTGTEIVSSTVLLHFQVVGLPSRPARESVASVR